MHRTIRQKITHRMNVSIGILAAFTITTLFTEVTDSQHVTVVSEQELGEGQGGFNGNLIDSDQFGWSVASLGDLDGDGIGDLAVGSRWDNVANSHGVWVLLLRADGSVRRTVPIGNAAGGFTGPSPGTFGFSLANIGDLDGDGRAELAVGDTPGGIWILFLNDDGTVRDEQYIDGINGEFNTPVKSGDIFGSAITSIGDLNNDGATYLAVGGMSFDGDGAVWILFLNPDGTVLDDQIISEGNGGFVGPTGYSNLFGRSVAAIGDLDGDGNIELAVGEPRNDDGGFWRGAVWILFLNSDGTVRIQRKISDYYGGFNGILSDRDQFGTSLALIDDLDGDGYPELAVGAPFDDDHPIGETGGSRGAIWILSLYDTGFVRSQKKISASSGGFSGALQPGDWFGFSIAQLADINNNGIGELAVGAPGDDGFPTGSADQGAMWVILLNDEPGCPGDLDGNQDVNVFDLVILLDNWLTDATGADLAAPENIVDIFDILVILDSWGACS